MNDEEENSEGWESVFRAERTKLGDQGSRVHHWWPRGIQKYWSYQDKINSLSCNGKVESVSVKNRNIAKLDHAHTVKHSSETKTNDPYFGKVNYEPLFKEVDDHGSNLVGEIERISFKGAKVVEKLRYIYFLYRGMSESLQKQATKETDESLRISLVRLILSIYVRSPGYRHRYDARINHFWNGRLSREQVKPITALNLIRDWRGARDALDSPHQKYNISLLTSLRKKFDFPDGFPCTVDFDRCLVSGFLTGDLLMPLTPDICIFVEFKSWRSLKETKGITSAIVHDDVVSTINEAFQYTAKQRIYFHKDPPLPSDALTSGIPALVRPADLGLAEALQAFRL